MNLFETIAEITRPEILTEKEFHEQIFNEAYIFATRNRNKNSKCGKEKTI
jgi:hypothetical protein